MNGRKWTEAEVEIIRAYAEDGKTIREVADLMGFTYDQIYQQAMKHNFTFRSVVKKRGKTKRYEEQGQALSRAKTDCMISPWDVRPEYRRRVPGLFGLPIREEDPDKEMKQLIKNIKRYDTEENDGESD